MKTIHLIIFSLLFIVQASFAQNELPESFTDGLNRAQMTFDMPEGFTETEPIQNPHMLYEYALKHNTEKFEVRYAIRPIDEMLRSYKENEENKKEGDVNIDPNTMSEAIAMAVGFNISGNMPKMGPFDADAVKREFNADKGYTTFVEAREGFDNGYKYCMMVCIFKENLGNAFYFYMADNQETLVKMMPGVFHTLKFK